MLTIDCGITAVDEVRRARELGLEVIVTDHHRAGDELPDCPVVATKELCGTGVAFKLGQALLGADSARPAAPSRSRRARDDRGRRPAARRQPTLTIAGLRTLARTQKPGLQALMGVAHVDPATVDTGQVGSASRRESMPPGGSGIGARR